MDNERYQGYHFQSADQSSNVYQTKMENGVYTCQHDSEHANEEKEIPKRPYKKGLALLACFVAVAFIFSFGSAYVMRQFMLNERSTQAAGSQSISSRPAAPAPGVETVEANTGNAHDQVTPTGSTTHKHFSILSAAAKDDGDKKALSIMDIAKKGKPSVVAISTEKAVGFGYYQSIMPVAGSGIIISDDGYIATNNHVVGDSQNIKVHLDNGSLYDAKLIGGDALTDLAVIKIEPRDGEKFTPATFGNSDDLVVGELAVAIGNPAGTLEGSVTAGIISALQRNINVRGTELNVLQTDASINSGNSGGALFNSFGEVIGINTAKLSSSGSSTFDGIAFAIPVNVARPILEDLVKYGYITDRVQFGITGQGVDSDFAKFYNLADRPGVLIKSVEKGSSADKAGLVEGDFIVEINGHTVESVQEINNLKHDLKVGDEVEVIYFRNGEKKSCMMTMQAAHPEEETTPTTESTEVQ